MLASDSDIISGGFEYGVTNSSSVFIFYTKIACYKVARRDHLTSNYQHGSQSQNV